MRPYDSPPLEETKPTKYKLLKDLPNLNAGAIFELVYCGIDGFYKHNSCGNKVEYNQRLVENNPEWFEKVEEKAYTVREICKALSKALCRYQSGPSCFETAFMKYLKES